MFPMTVTLHSQQQLNAVLAALAGPETPTSNSASAVQALVNKVEAGTVVAKPADPQQQRAAETAPTQRTAGAAQGDAHVKKETSTSEAAETVYDYGKDIKPRVLHLITKLGKRKEVMATLEKFGVDHAEKVPADKYPQLVTALDALKE